MHPGEPLMRLTRNRTKIQLDTGNAPTFTMRQELSFMESERCLAMQPEDFSEGQH
jgi:hypothetical protein